MRRASLLVLVVALVASVAVVGSALANGGGTDGPRAAAHDSLPLRAKPNGKPFTVKIKVVQRKSETLALVPVTVHGKELAFIVDTGAAQTQVTEKVADELGLAKAGKPKTVSGVGCNTKAQPVKIDQWSLDGHALPTTTGDASKLALAKGELAGLLGSDVWSSFGSVQIDYANETLTVG
jgi:hypothetical protein